MRRHLLVALAELAQRNYGLVGPDQLRQIGVNRNQVQRLAASGLYVVRHRWVLASTAVPASYEQDLLAPCLALGPKTAVSHRSALWLWGLDGRPPDGRPPYPVEVVTAGWSRRKLRGVKVRQATDLETSDIVLVRRIPVTSVVRTIVDSVGVVPRKTGERLVDRGAHTGLTTYDALRDYVEVVARRGRRGAGIMRPILAVRDEIPAGESEALLRQLLIDFDLPPGIGEHQVVDGIDPLSVDRGWPEFKLAVEIDGYGPHSAREQFDRDRRRWRRLRALGWTVLILTYDDLVNRPAMVAAEIRRAITELVGK
jgi:hypothetical protein